MTWVAHLSDWRDTGSPGFGSWVTDHWETGTGFVEIYTDLTGKSWQTGYRPTKVRFTVDATTTDADLLIAFDLQDGAGSIASNYTTYPAGVSVVEINISGQVSDLTSFDVFFDNSNLSVGKLTNLEFWEGDESIGSSVGTIEATFEALAVSANTPTGTIEATFEAIAYTEIVPHGTIEINFEALGKNPISGVIEATFEAVAEMTLLPPVVAKFVISTRYLMTLTGDTDVDLETVSYWHTLADNDQTGWNGTYWDGAPLGGAGFLSDLVPTGIWANGYRPDKIEIDIDISTGGPAGPIPTVRLVVVLENNQSGHLIDETKNTVYGRTKIVFSMPTMDSNIVRIVIIPTGLPDHGYGHTHGIKFTVTGQVFVYTLPASSLSISSRSGNPSVISAVIPYAEVYALAIASVTHGVIKIYRSQTDSAGATSTDLIEYGTLATVQSDIGPKNASIILTANSTKTSRAVKHVTLNGLQYVATVNGKLRVRCTPSNDLTVGDTVSIGDYSLIANNIQLSVTSTLEMMEIYE